LKQSLFIIGNSSSGIIEAPYLKTHCINIGSRQNKRISKNLFIYNCNYEKQNILQNINKIHKLKIPIKKINNYFGNGQSAELFLKVLSEKKFWQQNLQKYFVDFINR
jgi:UDP-N-acetylglucosamine 2-epimerase (hydrolysing)